MEWIIRSNTLFERRISRFIPFLVVEACRVQNDTTSYRRVFFWVRNRPNRNRRSS